MPYVYALRVCFMCMPYMYVPYVYAVTLIASDNAQSASINYDCYCEWGSNIQPALQASTEICYLPAVLTPEQAQAAVSVKLPDVCAAFGSNAASVTSLSPGVLQWLDTLGISKRVAYI